MASLQSSTVNGDLTVTGSITEGGYTAYPERVYTINFSAQSSSNFYPIVLDNSPGSDATWHHTFSVEMPNQGGGVAYNMHSIYGEVRGQGWSDASLFYRIFQNFYDNAERSILGIWRGTQSWYGVVVYVRGGQTYYVRTNSRTVAGYTSAVTLNSNATFAIKNASNADVSGTSANISQILNLINNPSGFYHSDVVYGSNFSGSGSSLTNLTAGNLSGTIPSAVLGNSSLYVGTTQIALNRSSASQTLTGISIDGNAATTTLATKASTLSQGGGNGSAMTFNWSGQGGQPTWLWGSNNGTDIYVWNPSNFSVANSANLTLTGLGTSTVNVGNTSTAVYRNENGLGAVSAYAPVLHVSGGDTMWQIQGTYGGSGNGTLYFRQGLSGSWGNWLTMLSSANYTSYSPSLTGSGASGNWGINITGTAANVTAVNLASQSTTTSTLSAGAWYTIAVNAGDRASAKFTITNEDSGLHQAVHFYATSQFGTIAGARISVISNTYYAGPPIGNIRIMRGGTYDGAMLQVYLNNNCAIKISIYDNQQNNGWVIKNGVVSTSDPGGVANFAALTTNAAQVDLNSGKVLSITDDIYIGGSTTQYKALHANNYSSYALPLSGGTLTGNSGVLLTSTNDARFDIRSNTAGAWLDIRSETNGYAAVNLYGGGATTGMWSAGMSGGSSSYRITTGAQGAGSEVMAINRSNLITNFPNALQQGGNQVLHAGNYSSYALPLTGGTVSGATTFSTSISSPIFYDSNDTNYYCDPNSISVLAAVRAPSVGSSYTNHLQIREANGGNGVATDSYAPSIGFHWANVVASNITLESSGRISIRNNPGTGYENFIANIVYGSSSVQTPIVYDSNNTSYYLDPASTSNLVGLTVANTISGSISGNAATSTRLSDATGALRIGNPGGASYATSTSTVTGAIKIKLPTAGFKTNTMLRFTVKIYEYAGSSSGISRTFEIGGYNYSDGQWYNFFATQNTMGGGEINVRFGNDGASNCVWIGDTNTAWNYPQVAVIDFQAGFSNYTDAIWGTGWAISFITTFDTVTNGPIIAAKPLNSQNYNTYAPTLTGTGASGTWGISITGDAAGSAASGRKLGSWDGTTYYGGTNTISTSGGRAVNLAPNTYTQSISFEFKNGSFTSINGNYAGLITIAPWLGTTASTGDPNYQLLFYPAAANSVSAPTMRIRAGIDASWGSWSTILHENNYSGYSSFSGSVTSGYGSFASPGFIIGDAQYGLYVSGGSLYYKSASGGVHYWRNIANNDNTMYVDNSGNLVTSRSLTTSSIVRIGGAYTGNNSWINSYFGGNIYWDGSAWQNYGFSGNNGWGSLAITGTNGDFYWMSDAGTGTSNRSYTEAQFLAKTKMILTGGGNLGIGTTAPATLLQIGQLTPNAATSGIQFGDDTGARIYRGGSNAIQISNVLQVGSYIYGSSYLQLAGNYIYPQNYTATLRLAAGNSGATGWIDGLTVAQNGDVSVYNRFKVVRGSSVVYYNSTAESFGSILGAASSSSRSTFFCSDLTNGGASVWWGRKDASNNNVPCGAIDSNDGTLSHWVNSGGTAGTWSNIFNVTTAGITMVTGNFVGSLSGTATTANALNTSNNYQVNSIGISIAASGTAGSISLNQLGTRSWSITPSGGNLNFASGDSSGVVNLSIPLTLASSVGSTPYLNLPASVTLSANAANELVIRNLGQLRFTTSNDWSYNSWAGIKYDQTATTLYLGGPNSGGVFSANASPGNVAISFVGTSSVSSNSDFRAPIFYDSANTAYYLDAANAGNSLIVAGNVGIGTTSPNHTLAVIGNVFVNSLSTNGTVYSNGRVLTNTNPSDINLKTNIAPLHHGLESINNLNPVSFNWKSTPDAIKSFGLIAQEVQKIIPEIVREDKDLNTLGLDTVSLIPILIEAVKELTNKNIQLEARLSALESKLQ